MLNPVFIAGSGRSGTTVLKRLLTGHRDIFSLRDEARFLTDPDGLRTVCDALSDGWSSPSSQQALTRFERMMRQLRRRSWSFYMQRGLQRLFPLRMIQRMVLQPYSSYGLATDLGYGHYDRSVAAYLADLTAYRFPGRWAGQEGPTLHPEVRLGKRLPRAEIFKISAGFVEQLLQPAMERSGATRWCEDTPGNMHYAGFLAELFPSMKLIHIVRDPRDILASTRHMPWASPNVEDLVKGMTMLTERWRHQKDQLPAGCLLELRLEDLVADPVNVIPGLLDVLGLEPDPALAAFDLSRHHTGRYREELTEREISLIEEAGKDWMEAYGYR